MGRERRKREHALPRFPFHCYTNPYDRLREENGHPIAACDTSGVQYVKCLLE